MSNTLIAVTDYNKFNGASWQGYSPPFWRNKTATLNLWSSSSNIRRVFPASSKDRTKPTLNPTTGIAHNSVLSEIEWNCFSVDLKIFRFQPSRVFRRKLWCDQGGDLYDVAGHLRLIDGQQLQQCHILESFEGTMKGRFSVHLQLKEGPPINYQVHSTVNYLPWFVLQYPTFNDAHLLANYLTC